MKKNYCLLIVAAAFIVGCKPQVDTLEPSETNIITFSADHSLSYVEFGPSDGKPVFYFHGFPGSHQDIHIFKGAELAEEYGIRLIAVDRPGYGNSTSMPDRTLSDWPDDVAQLANALELEHFSILAYSGGGPFAIACAHAIPDRLEKVVVVSGMGPADAPEAKKGKAMVIPKAPKLILKGMSSMLVKKPEKLEANMRKGFPEVDAVILDQSNTAEIMNLTIEEAFSSGYLGALEDALIYKKPWDFELENIQSEITLWHGDKDENVKMETARYVAEQLPNGQLKAITDEGHLSLIYKQASEIFSTLAEH